MTDQLDEIEMQGVRTVEEDTPMLVKKDNGRWHVFASCDGGCAATSVDLFDLIQWLRDNQPWLLEAAIKS